MDFDNLIGEGYDLLYTPMQWPTFDGGNLDRTKFVTSSEVGGCARQIAYGKHVVEVGDPSVNSFPNWGFAERGNLIEAWAVKQIRAALPWGCELKYAGEDQVSFYDGYQSGTPDGVLVYPDKSVTVLEIKSIDPRTNYNGLPKPKHTPQVQQNADLVSHCLDVTVRSCVLLYIDASNLQKRKQFVQPPNQVLMRELEEKATAIMTASSPDDLPATGIYDGSCKYCAFTDKCSAALEAKQKEAEAFKLLERAANGFFT